MSVGRLRGDAQSLPLPADRPAGAPAALLTYLAAVRDADAEMKRATSEARRIRDAVVTEAMEALAAAGGDQP